MPLPDYVRVRLDNGSHVSVSRARADQLGLKPLKQPALNRDGTIRPAKHRLDLSAGSATTPTTEADASESKED